MYYCFVYTKIDCLDMDSSCKRLSELDEGESQVFQVKA